MSTDDEDLGDPKDKAFRSAMRGVRPLKWEGRFVHRRKKPRVRRPTAEEDVEHPQTLVAAPLDLNERLSYRASGIDQRVLRRLSRGEFPVEAKLDLHGLTLAAARPTLKQFVSQARERGLRCVRVVHGRGLGSGDRGPVLKAGVNTWLRQWYEVIAFASATERDGGGGAVYVLLRRLP